jgi:PAS domain S-box-containing protein
MKLSSVRPDGPLEVTAATTAEMLAALPGALMLPDGALPEERRLTDVLALYRAVFLNSTEAIAMLDPAGRYIEQNPAHLALLGYTDQELRGRTPAIHFGEEAFAAIVSDLRQAGVSRREVTSHTKTGQQRVIDISAFVVRDRAGLPVCYVGIERDVTEQREARAELERRFAELQVVYGMADSLGHARAPEQIYDEAIDGLLRVVRADRASILLFDEHDLMRFRAWRGLSDAYRSAVEGHSPWNRDTRDPRPVTVADVREDATLAALRPVVEGEGIRALAFVPLIDEGVLLGKFMLYFDAPHAWTDDELRLANTIARHVSFAIVRHRRESELNEANRAKSIFLATMSHELRTPLNAIAGYTDLLDAGVHGTLTPSQGEAVQRIQVNQRHLLRLIDDVLDFAKLEAGHLTLDIADVPVQDTLDATRLLIEPQLRSKRIAFEFVPGDAAISCRADRAKMQQVLANLLSNAWKFTPPGGTVSLTWDATPDRVRIHVRDTGPGIPAQSLETVFEPFVQLQMGFRRRVEGTGLGLAISRELARGMSGDVAVTSVVDEGSTFTLTLPRR